MRFIGIFLALCAFWSGPLRAADFVQTRGILSDSDFYRVVSCGAAPGKPCAEPAPRWASNGDRVLTVAFAQRDAGFPSRTARSVLLGLRNTVRQINRAGLSVSLAEVSDARDADILVYLQDIPEGGTITGTGLSGLDGVQIEIGRFYVSWNRNREITRAAIVLSRDLAPIEAASVILEEVVQSLGLIWDIRNPSYRGRSIFDEDSNKVIRLRGQDLTALRLHYPRSVP